MQKGRILIIDDNEDEHITPVHDIILFLIIKKPGLIDL